MARGKVGARIGAVLGDTGSEGIETVVLELVVQFVQKFHADDFTVRPLGAQAVRPLQAMGFQQHAAAIHIVRVERRSHAQVGHAGQGCVAQAVYQHGKNAAGGRLPVGKAQVQGAEAVLRAVGAGAQGAPQFAAMHHMA